MKRRHSRLGEQNERGFWPKRARSVGERIRNPDGTRSTHLPGPAALWVLHTAAPPTQRRVHAQTRHPLEPLPGPGWPYALFCQNSPVFTSAISASLLVSFSSILIGVINYMVTLLKPHCMQPQCLDCVAFLLPPEHCFSLLGEGDLEPELHTRAQLRPPSVETQTVSRVYPMENTQFKMSTWLCC